MFDFALASFDPNDPLAPLRERIASHARADEPALVRALADEARLAPDALHRTQALAARLAEGVRAERARAGGVDALMHEFSLDSVEGVALMCLAEALLRVPDAATRDRLIRDKIASGDWRAHVGASPSLFVNAAAWGLLVTGRLVDTRGEGALDGALASLVRKGGEPLIRAGVDVAMRMLGRQFVAGRTIHEAIANGREREARGYRHSYDMLGEAALTARDAKRYFDAYDDAIRALGAVAGGRGVRERPGISVKLSALHPRFSRAQRERVVAELVPRAVELARTCRALDLGFNVDAEEADRLELTLDVFAALAADPAFAGWDGLGFVVQAYQKRARFVVDWLAALARLRGRRFMVRLVKGAYWDAEVKRAQIDGVDDYPVFTRKTHTDVCYLACAKALLAAGDAVYPQFATHNAFTLAAVHTIAGDADYEFQCLHGMGETLFDQVVGRDRLDRPCRIYAPVGSHETLLAYLVRRLLENGSNTSFVNRVVDPRVSVAELVADPVAQAEADRGEPHPRIAKPIDLYRPRANSRGVDLSDDPTLVALSAAMSAPAEHAACPLLGCGDVAKRPTLDVFNPADRDDVVGRVVEAAASDAREAVRFARDRGAQWSRTPVDERAACLERAADLLEAEAPRLYALAIREAGKTLADAVAEVREAVDFCRYYAAQARDVCSRPGVTARGPIVCISPWNFPLSIFVGQVSAALAAGNPVLAKPAEQTPLIAAAAVRALHHAGVPVAALQLLPGRGEDVGAALVADADVAGVLFTGSTDVARAIDRTLAAHPDPLLVAETGGQNAMIVDSSSLPEQVVVDALVSAFDSAGQRCSALRVLCVQDDVAAPAIAMLTDALAELRVGDPRRLATDVGPVIDEDARAALEAHVERMRAAGVPVVRRALPAECERGTFVAPTVVDLGRVDGLRMLEREVFGPVLHVVRWRADELDALVDAINATGYALTHGIHTRIDDTVARIVARVQAGNVYVNRNIIGAVVGVQPFGGHGLSGTGPKAGGPLYVRRLVRGLRDAPPFDAAAASGRVLCAQTLPGPTGEANVLEWHRRGVVGCVAASDGARATQRSLAQATGNLARDTTVEQAIAAVDIDALLVDDADRAARVRAGLAGRAQRPLVPVLTPDDGGRYDWTRLVVERSVCTNTAAAGGNAALLAQAGDVL
jgi:RHH-type proline utilization regulon transcriptional repressor/proline dehydrogenase/delta 1-pyrroline-5-carboxylate dehydrogenase